MKNLLFVCEMNMQRSPTFERWFKENTFYNVKSAGTQFGSEVELNKDLLKWADIIYCMDIRQEISIEKDFEEFWFKTETIGVSDEYPRDSPQLIHIIKYWFKTEGL